MIYKFEDELLDVIEFQQVNDTCLITLTLSGEDISSSVVLDSKDVYKLIGSLHEIQKDIKEFKGGLK